MRVIASLDKEKLIHIGFWDSEKATAPEDSIDPTSLLFTVFPVLPTCARPWVVKGGVKRDDDLTTKYNAILKYNARLKGISTSAIVAAKPLSAFERAKVIQDMQLAVCAIIESGKDSASRQFKGLQERLSGKEGYIKNHMAAKRVDFSARSVIAGGGTLVPMGWLGVPRQVMQALSIPETVTKWNIAYCDNLLNTRKVRTVVRGKFTIDVATITKGWTRPFVWAAPIGIHKSAQNGMHGVGETNGTDPIVGLKEGDIIHRILAKGDWSLFNRQPTLRTESMLGVQMMPLPSVDHVPEPVKEEGGVTPIPTSGRSCFQEELIFRLPLGMTRPLNADQH